MDTSLQSGNAAVGSDLAEKPWQAALFETLRRGDVRQMAYVPDAGHARLIRMFEADPAVQSTVLTTEEEGVALVAGAWLGGQRSVLLMQSSGVGNCVNMFSLLTNCRFPMLTIVTMRGEWAEFNPWQVAMGGATRQAFEMMGVLVYRAEQPEDVAEIAESALTMAFDGDQQVAILLSQRLLGAKKW